MHSTGFAGRRPPAVGEEGLRPRLHSLYRPTADFVMAAMQVTQVFSVRLAFLTLATPVFVLFTLVAETNGGMVGHILFSPVPIEDGSQSRQGMGLAPMAVMPNRQRQGIGSKLIEAGLEILREQGCPFIIVLGHPEFYPRFGFVPASRHGLRCQWAGVPDAAFMVLVLGEATMAGVTGVARYREEFEAAM